MKYRKRKEVKERMRYHFAPRGPEPQPRGDEVAVKARVMKEPRRFGFEAIDVIRAKCPFCSRETVMERRFNSWPILRSCKHYNRLDFGFLYTWIFFLKREE
jgi:hypothetical protein